ncbi:unnamed protein product [Soboliphyme baturini]|uniref:GDP-L-fucose synthase n=1 Tax=Soboliphyme baturini TaxID=241478 RepID=A0A183IZV4_9BILA|nr:unnamed protein product [Soboliphyme baturini]
MSKEVVILVTGGTGLVGKAIETAVKKERKEPNEKWVFLSSKDGDLSDYNQTKALFDKYKPTHVLHLAAKVGGLFSNLQNNLLFFRENMAINSNVLQCANESGVQNLISCSSTCVFPDQCTYPLTESMMHMGPPHSSNFGYAYAKRMGDVLSQLYNREFHRHYMLAIPCNVYGPYDNFNLQSSHVIPGLIHKCYLAKRDKTPLVVYGSGKPLRQFIYSMDLARLFVWALFNYKDTTPIIFSVGEEDEKSIREIVDIIVKAMEFDGEVIYDTTKNDGQFKKTASNAKLRSLLPDFKFTPLEQALKETATWFTQNFDTARK